MTMLKDGRLVVATSVFASALALACSFSSGDDDSSPGVSGGSSNSGGAPVGFNGGSTSYGGAASTGGSSVVAFGGNTSTGGIPGASGNGFDGGSVPITEQQKKDIMNQACTGFLTEGETLPSVLQLVVDVSSSMNQRAPGSNNQTKWEVTREALRDAVVGINGTGLSASVAVGLLFYPNTQYTVSTTAQPLESCVNTSAMVPIDVLGPKGAPQRSRIDQALVDVQLQVSTPTHDAYRYALNNSLLPSKAPGKKFMLLITDGTPTVSLGCLNTSGQVNDVDPQPIVGEITTASQAGVKTFLIGSPGSENNRTWMSTAAVIGGTANPGCNVTGAGTGWCHMDMTQAPDFSAALKAGLGKVVGQVTPCTFTFADPPPGEEVDSNNINVILNSGGQSWLIVRDDVGDCSQGWQLTADKEVLLCPDTCSQVKSDAGAAIDLVFGCQPLTEPLR